MTDRYRQYDTVSFTPETFDIIRGACRLHVGEAAEGSKSGVWYKDQSTHGRWSSALHGLNGTQLEQIKELVRSTVAPRRRHSGFSLRNIYITRHMPRTKQLGQRPRASGLAPAILVSSGHGTQGGDARARRRGEHHHRPTVPCSAKS